MAWMRSPTRIASSASWVTSSVGVPAPRKSASGLLADLRAQGGIEGRERLVQQHQLRRRRQRPGQRHALLLAARQGVRICPGVGAHVDCRQELGHALLTAASVVAVQPKGDVLADAQVRKQGEVLKHQADAATLRRQAAAGLGEQPAIEGDPPGLQILEPGDQAQRGGLAAAGRPNQAVHLAGLDRHRDAVDHEPVAEAMRHLFDLEAVLASRQALGNRSIF